MIAKTRIILGVVRRPLYLRLKHVPHHEESVLYHNLRVARLSYYWGGLVERYTKLKFKRKALLRGALLHDFFFYNWRTTRPENGKLHAFEHSRESARRAHRYYRITRRESNIILSHMWPLGENWPKHIESWLVTFADKWISAKELLRKWLRKELKGV